MTFLVAIIVAVLSLPAAAENNCVRLKVGQSAVVNFGFDDSPTKVEARYGLSRPKEDLFLVEVNLRFKKGPGYEGALSPAELNTSFRQRVGACLKEYEGILKNERAGRSMILRIAENASVPVFEIEVGAPSGRASMAKYPSGVSCPTILHEVLHVLGLADEYIEKPKLGVTANDCRVAGPADSVMNDESEAVGRAGVAEKIMAVEMCQCEKPGMGCVNLAIKNDGRGKECPAGTTKFLRNLDPNMKTSVNALNSFESFVLNEEARIPAGEGPPRHNSALYPAHFRVITEPGCSDVNGNYYECVANMFRYSKPALGVAPDDRMGCLPKPPACSFNSLKWME